MPDTCWCQGRIGDAIAANSQRFTPGDLLGFEVRLRDRYAQAGFLPQHPYVIPNGIRLAKFSGPPRGAANLPLKVLFAGRLDPPKGADLAAAAVASVSDVNLVLAGGGNRSSVLAMERQVAQLGLKERVSLTGELPRDLIAALMRGSDIFAMPAREPDAFGLVYVEAMAAGAVVVGTAKDRAADICRHGENGLVVGDQGTAQLDTPYVGHATIRSYARACVRGAWRPQADTPSPPW